MYLLIVLGPTPVGLFFTAVMATAPTEDDIWRAIDRLGRKYRVSEFIVYYLKAGRHLESEATSTLQEQWALARRNSITAHNRWQILSLEIELALRGEAVDGLFRNATSLTVAEQAALLQSGWKLSGFDWLPTVDEATGNVVQFSKGRPRGSELLELTTCAALARNNSYPVAQMIRPTVNRQRANRSFTPAIS